MNKKKMKELSWQGLRKDWCSQRRVEGAREGQRKLILSRLGALRNARGWRRVGLTMLEEGRQFLRRPDKSEGGWVGEVGGDMLGREKGWRVGFERMMEIAGWRWERRDKKLELILMKWPWDKSKSTRPFFWLLVSYVFPPKYLEDFSHLFLSCTSVFWELAFFINVFSTNDKNHAGFSC